MYKHLSFSSLSKLEDGLESFLDYKNNKKSTDSLRKGSLVDLLIDDTDISDYFILDNNLSIPTATSLNLANDIIQEVSFDDFDIIETGLKICKREGYWTSYSENTIIKNIKKLEKYIKYKVFESDKEIIDNNTLLDSQKVANSIKATYEKCEKLFNLNPKNKLIQYELDFIYKDLPFKGILDRVYLNHEEKSIVCFDNKTTGFYTNNFIISFFKYKYFYQGALYKLGLQTNFPDYDVKFYFMVESFINPGKYPRVFPFETDEKYFEGFSRVFQDYKGIDNIIDDFKWYQQNGFDLERSYIENNGIDYSLCTS